MKLQYIAAVGVVVGILLHVSAAYVILGSGDSGEDITRPAPTAVAQQPTATPVTPGDRQNCSEIAGTEYRSASEREWYLRNCTRGFIAPASGAALLRAETLPS
jgi:hypothetical protein